MNETHKCNSDDNNSKLFTHLIDFFPNYAKLNTKCGMLLYYGSDWYKKNDFFHYPKKNWSKTMIKDVSSQIFNNLAGISRSNPLNVKCLWQMFQFLQMFHFEVKEFELVCEMGLIKVIAENLVDHEKLTLFFLVEDANESC